MLTSKHRKLAARMGLFVLAGIVILGVAVGAFAQQPPPPNPQPNAPPNQAAKLTAKSAPPTAAMATRMQQPEFVGPPAPGSPHTMTPPGAAKPASDVPQPTVVLKPGEVPAIKFDQADWDFGRIPAGPEISHDFWFTNTGTGPLEILKVRPG